MSIQQYRSVSTFCETRINDSLRFIEQNILHCSAGAMAITLKPLDNTILPCPDMHIRVYSIFNVNRVGQSVIFR